MKQTKILIITALAALLLAQCNLAAARENLKNCKYSLEDVHIKGMSFTGMDLGLVVGVENTNQSEVIVDRMDVDIFLDQKNIGKANNSERIAIKAGEKKAVEFKLKSSFAQMGTALISNLKGSGEIPYKLQGTAYVQIPLVGEVAFPFAVEDVLKK